MENLTAKYRHLFRGFPLAVFPFDQRPMAPHVHDFCELVYVRKGSGLHRHGRRNYPVHKGDCFMIFPGEAHGYLRGEGLRIVNVLFYPAIFGDGLAKLESVPGFRAFFALEPLFRDESAFRHKLHLHPAQQRAAEALLEALAGELSERRPGFEACATGLFLQLAVHVVRCFTANLGSQGTRALAGMSSSVEAAMAYLEENLGRDVGRDEVARSAALSPSRLSHLFKEKTGSSLREYLNRIRLDRAAQLLRQGATPIRDVAAEVGFADPDYFARAFRRSFGVTPRGYRGKA